MPIEGTWTYSGDPANSSLDQVRFLVRDTRPTNPLVSDEEIAWAIAEHADLYSAAAEVADAIALSFAALADKSVDGLSISYNARARTYADLSKTLQTKSTRHSVATPFASGIYKDAKETNELDDNVVQPSFGRGMHDHVGTTGITSSFEG